MSPASDEPSAPRTFRLSEVTRRLRDILLPATEKQFWVRAQFVPDKVRSSGNLYGNLVETDARGKEIARPQGAGRRET